MTWCSIKGEHLALSILVYFNTTFTFKLEHSISDTLGLRPSKYPGLCLQHMYIIRFCPDLYCKELFASLPQISYANNGGMHIYQNAKAVGMKVQCLNVKVTWGWET